MDIIGKISGRALADDGKSAPLSADVIFYKRSKWFVPKWIERRSEGLKTPERIVCLDTILYRDVPFGPTQFQLDEPIPRDVLYGDVPPELNGVYIVVLRPEILVPMPRENQ